MRSIILALKKILEEIKQESTEMAVEDIKMELAETLKYETFLDDPNSKWWRRINLFIIFLILLSVVLLIFESVWDNAIRYKLFLFWSDAFISTIFAIEYFYRFWYAREKLKFIIRPMNIIDFLAFIPFYIELILQGLIDISYLKVLRILRVFRLFKLFRHIKIINKIIFGIKKYYIEYLVWFFAVFVVIILSSVTMYYVEWGINEWFKDIPSAIRWAIVTATTVWYWDVYPQTVLWKIIWSIVILIWPMVVAMVSSITVLVFMEVATAHKMEKEALENLIQCPRCGNKDNDQDANYCKICGEKLNR